MEVLEAVCEEENRWALDQEMQTLWEIRPPCHSKKRHHIVPIAATKVTMLDPFLRVIRGSGK